MINHQSPALQANFAAHIRSAYSALKCPLTAIFQLFPDREVSLIEYSHNGLNDKLVEVRLEAATLSCLFDANHRCDTSFLFLDNLDDLAHYIAHCNNTYRYDYLLKVWKATDYSVKVQKGEKDYFLVIERI